MNILILAVKRRTVDNSAHSSSKFAGTGLTQNLSERYALNGIRVGAVYPALIETSSLMTASDTRYSHSDKNASNLLEIFTEINQYLIFHSPLVK